MNFPNKSLLLALALGTTVVVSTPLAAHPQQAPCMRDGHAAAPAGTRFERAARQHPALAVAIDLRRLERIYRHSGHDREIVSMYQDLLQHTQHPKLRAFAERRLKHADRVVHPEATIAELRQRIDARLTKLR